MQKKKNVKNPRIIFNDTIIIIIIISFFLIFKKLLCFNEIGIKTKSINKKSLIKSLKNNYGNKSKNGGQFDLECMDKRLKHT